MDFVFIEGLEIFAHHGLTQEEQELGRVFRFDVRIGCNTKNAGHTDDINQTVDYAKIVRLIADLTTSKRYQTVERLAEVIAESILQQFTLAEKIVLKVSKLMPPYGYISCAAGVEITRSQN